MHIKGISLKGFKSFPDPLTIWFDNNITAVVGPNGSGKSNIVDAVRWVLGEQSAKSLRGGKMEDLIFAGSAGRSAQRVAEVNLILDNSRGELPLPQEEVRVGRKVSAGNGSTYLLNGEPCRLKDIENILIDGGVRRDSSAILGQGKIETILISRPLDRRELFEEAAGIIKYKMRKKEAQTKLENTRLQSQRIRDVIHELNRQARPLRKQAQIAREYTDLTEELTKLEVNLFLGRHQSLQKEYNKLQTEKKEKEEHLGQGKQALKKCRGVYEEIRDRLGTTERLLERKKEEIYRLASVIETQKNKAEINKERIKVFAQQKEETDTERRLLAQNMEQKKNEKSKLEEELAGIERKINEIEKEVDSFTREEKDTQKTWDDLSREKEELREIIREALNEAGRNRFKCQEIEAQSKRLHLHLQEDITLKEEKAKYLETVIASIKEKEAETTDKEEILQRLKKEETDKKLEIKELTQNIESLQKTVNNLQRKTEKLQNRRQLLHQLRESRHGYHKGVKKVLEAARNGELRGISGVVEDLVQIEEGYEEAIKAALEGRGQNIITDSDKDAETAVAFLKEKKVGRATFLPLNLVRIRNLREKEKELLQIPGIIDTAINFVRFPASYRPAFAHLLNRVLVADNLKAAIEAAHICGGRLRIVTLEGDVINPGGAITGGIQQKSQVAELVRIEESLTSNQKELEEKNKKLMEARMNLQEAKKAEAEYRQALQEGEIELKSWEKELQLLDKTRQKTETEVAVLEDKIKKSWAELTQLKDDIKSKKKIIGSYQRDYQDWRNKLQVVEGELEKLRTEQGDSQGVMMTLQVELAANKQKRENLQNLFQRLTSEVAKLEKDANEKNQKSIELQESISNLEVEIARVVQQKEENLADYSELEKEIETGKEQREALQVKLKKEEKRLKELTEKIELMEQEAQAFRIDEMKISAEIERIRERLQREYEMTITTAAELRDKSIGLDAAAKRIPQLKDKKKELGFVNLGAIQEYAQLEKRLLFMKEQHKDLREAQDALRRIIDSINKTMADRFLVSFKRVAEEFETVFQKLFQGGTARLYLSNEEDLLETGVEVEAQPPGKKLQKLSLMSGGEKALTAIALLFALMKVKPCPFYILDEIDAPLDDANVERFVSFLKDLNDLSQFIIITHRKRTIAEADTIYGITMEEDGISKVISYRMKDKVG